MSVHFQLVVDCADPARQTAFWAKVLGYVPEPAPAGYATWKAYYRSLGVPEDELAEMADDDVDSIVDPDGVGPRSWFQPVPEIKIVKNRLHLVTVLGATVVRVPPEPGTAHYGVTMCDPEGNEFCVA